MTKTKITGVKKVVGVIRRAYAGGARSLSSYYMDLRNIDSFDIKKNTTERIEDYISSRDSLCF